METQLSRTEKLDRLFGTPAFAVVIAILCNAMWGSAFPFIKLGYRLFAIDTADTASILCFAGVRFMLGSVLVLGGSLLLEGRLPAMPKGKILAECCALGLWQTTAQYAFFYSAVALLTGAFGGILNSTQSFLGVIFAHFLYGRADRMTPAKALGCGIGDELDLDELIYSDIILLTPTKFLCKEDCKGLCPTCGKYSSPICICCPPHVRKEECTPRQVLAA